MRYKIIVKPRPFSLEALINRAFSGMDKPLVILIFAFAGWIAGRIIVSLVFHR
jgi:hypothetical protein